MIMNVSLSKFRDEMNNSQWKDGFSYEALGRIYKELEEVYNEEYELDCGEVAAIYDEFTSIEEYNKQMYGYKSDYYVTIEELEYEKYILHLEDGGFILVNQMR